MIIGNLVSPKTWKSFVQQNILAPVLSWDLKQRLCFKMQSVPPVALLQWYRHNNLPLDALQSRARFPVCLLLYFLIHLGFAQYFQWHTFRHNSDNGGLSFPKLLTLQSLYNYNYYIGKNGVGNDIGVLCVSTSVKWYNSVDIVWTILPTPLSARCASLRSAKRETMGERRRGAP